MFASTVSMRVAACRRLRGWLGSLGPQILYRNMCHKMYQLVSNSSKMHRNMYRKMYHIVSGTTRYTLTCTKWYATVQQKVAQSSPQNVSHCLKCHSRYFNLCHMVSVVQQLVPQICHNSCYNMYSIVSKWFQNVSRNRPHNVSKCIKL